MSSSRLSHTSLIALGLHSACWSKPSWNGFTIPRNEGEFIQFPSSDIDQTSTPPSPLPPNAFFQDEPDIHFPGSDWSPSDFDLDAVAEPIPAELDPLEIDLGDERSDPTEFHPLINGMYTNCIIYNF